MVDITARLRQIRAMVDAGQYFTINRARQYGKTTTIRALGRYLEKDYLVVSLDFQKEMSAAKFSDENTFSLAFAKAFLLKIENSSEHIDGAFGVAVEELKKEMHNGRGRNGSGRIISVFERSLQHFFETARTDDRRGGQCCQQSGLPGFPGPAAGSTILTGMRRPHFSR